jgi:hypothetical protein
MVRPRWRWTLAAALVGAGLAAGAAAAATLIVSSESLTTHDASVSIAPSTCTLNSADADSYVSELLPILNFGNDPNLDVRSMVLDNKRTFVRFAITGCAIPANALVTSASLNLFMFTAPGTSATLEARRVTASWTETGITWTNQPAVAATATSSTATGTTPNVTLSWNVTADVQAFVDGTSNNGWRIHDQTESSLTTREAQFRSAEFGTASQQPILSITYFP